jgi:hypothetical protein
MHEADHIRFTPSHITKTGKVKLPSWLHGINPAIIKHVANCAEDIRITLVAALSLRGQRVIRDSACAALQDFRSIVASRRRIAELTAEQRMLCGLDARELAEMHNSQVTMALRGFALLISTGKLKSTHMSLVTRACFAALGVQFAGDTGAYALVTGLGRAAAKNANNMPRLAKAVAELMVIPPPPKLNTQPAKNDERSGRASEAIEGGTEEGVGVKGAMPTIHNPPRNTPCDGSGPVRRASMSGYTVSRRGIAAALHDPSARPFMRREQSPQRGHGSYLFDASGSMGVSAERLIAIASKVPGATMAYYSGGKHGNNLVVFARGGRRARGISAELAPGSGNGCDLESLRWLLRQPGPRFFVTDCGFCGDEKSALLEAGRLTRAAASDGRLQVIGSYDELARMRGIPVPKPE